MAFTVARAPGIVVIMVIPARTAVARIRPSSVSVTCISGEWTSPPCDTACSLWAPSPSSRWIELFYSKGNARKASWDDAQQACRVRDPYRTPSPAANLLAL